MRHWSSKEEEKLIRLLDQQIPIQDLVLQLDRTELALKRKIARLRKANRLEIAWTRVQIQELINLIHTRDSFEQIYSDWKTLEKINNWPQRTKEELEKRIKEQWQRNPWSPEEEKALALLMENEHTTLDQLFEEWKKLATKKNWYPRSKRSLCHKIRGLGGQIRLTEKGQYISTYSLAESLGVKVSQIERWIKSGLLKPSNKIQGECRYIHYKAVIRFAWDNPMLISQKVSESGIWWLLVHMQEYCSIKNKTC